MKKDKVTIGQCYSYKDHTWMVIEKVAKDTWFLEDRLCKTFGYADTKDLLTLRRQFQNWVS